ncbi:MAG: VWA domain-containing protein, partial [Calditrichaeota bacterium]
MNTIFRNSLKNITCRAAAWILLSAPIWAQGVIIIEPPVPPRPHPAPVFSPFPLEVRSLQVEVEIQDQAATTRIHQVFYNPTDYRVEGYYLFPLPPEAAVDAFSMEVDGKTLEGELLDAGEARRIYEDIVRRVRDPALLEYVGQGALKVRIFPVPPRSERPVTLSYRQVLPRENGTVAYRFPLKIDHLAEKPIGEINLSVRIRAQEEIQQVYCPTHEVEVDRRSEQEVRVVYEAEKLRPQRDFRLYYHTAATGVGLSFLSYRTGDEPGYFLLSIHAGNTGEEELPVVDKDVCFVVDVSGSMKGEKLEQARRAMEYCVSHLRPGDRFQIVRFSTRAEALFSTLQPADEARRKEAREFIRGFRAIGGTNLEAALKLALAPAGTPDRPYFVVFLTDGKPTIGEREEGKLLEMVQQRHRRGSRIFVFGIGEEVNTHLLDKMAEITRGYRTYIHPDESIDRKVARFFDKVSLPLLGDLSLSATGSIRLSEMYPHTPGDLFRGSTVTVLGRYEGSGPAHIVVEGRAGGASRQYRLPVDFPRNDLRHDFLPTLWATRAVGYLLDEIRLHGETEALRRELVHLARQYGIVTPYTDYLIREEELARHLPPDRRIIPYREDGGEDDR